MFSATFKNTVIYHIKLDSSSFPVHYEHYVITFHNLVVPAFHQIPSNYILFGFELFYKLRKENLGVAYISNVKRMARWDRSNNIQVLNNRTLACIFHKIFKELIPFDNIVIDRNSLDEHTIFSGSYSIMIL